MEETLDHREATKERAETEGVQTAENTVSATLKVNTSLSNI